MGVEAPLVYRNDGSGRFRAMPPEPFEGSEGDFGYFAVPVPAAGDQVIDFVVPQHHDGPDTSYGTEDDFTRLVTLLNTTRPSPHLLHRSGEPVPVADGNPAGPDNGAGRHADRGRVAGVRRPQRPTP